MKKRGARASGALKSLARRSPSFWKRKQRERHVAAFVTEAKAAYADVQIRERALALRVAETHGRYAPKSRRRARGKRR
jgi:hypothetical protein